MDESSIEQTIDAYKEQLVQIQTLISAADDLTKLELYDLEKDLMEMIKISEESLLETKKKNLLESLDESSNNIGNSFNSQSNGDNNINKQMDTSNENIGLDYVGTKCRVKYTQEWGTFQYHNAMILNCDVDDTLDDCQVKVHLLFLNPIHKSMVPCKYFLDGNCDYEATCKFSHGYIVDIEELEEYQEPDFTQLHKGGRCLAKYDEDGVWYPATVLSVEEEQAIVSYESYKETETLDFHSILPLSLVVESDDSSEDEGISNSNQNITQSYKSISMAGPMGDWEQHTKGIGSKLMLKMGYLMGKGLGKDGQGKIDPVEIRLLPPGKSLDYIAELREKGKIKDPLKSKNKNKKSKSHDGSESAFEIINKLTHKSPSFHSSNQPSCSSSASKFSIEDSYKSLRRHLKDKNKGDAKLNRKNNKDKKLNVEMFKVAEKINSLKRCLTSQKEALTRNPGDTPVSRRIKQNIDSTQKEIDELNNMDRSLQNKFQMKNQSKKLTVF